jgi:excisionase family DNA binding protein
MTATENLAATTSTAPEQVFQPPAARAVLDEPLFTVHEIAMALRVSPATVLRRIRAGELKAIRVGREWRVAKSEWSAYFERLAVVITGGATTT